MVIISNGGEGGMKARQWRNNLQCEEDISEGMNGGASEQRASRMV
jgi:hypothetical protein